MNAEANKKTNLYCSSASSPPGGGCVWYDRCGRDPDYPPSDSQHYLMCQYDGPAKQATPAMALIVRDICPHLLAQVWFGVTSSVDSQWYL